MTPEPITRPADDPQQQDPNPGARKNPEAIEHALPCGVSREEGAKLMASKSAKELDDWKNKKAAELGLDVSKPVILKVDGGRKWPLLSVVGVMKPKDAEKAKTPASTSAPK